MYAFILALSLQSLKQGMRERERVRERDGEQEGGKEKFPEMDAGDLSHTFRNGMTKGRRGKLVASCSLEWNSSMVNVEFWRRESERERERGREREIERERERERERES